jgi:hypothetical protein
MIQPLMVISFILSCLAVLLGLNNPHMTQLDTSFPASGNLLATPATTLIFLQNLAWLSLTLLIILCTLAPWISLVSILKIQNLSLVRNLPSLLVLLLLSFGTSLCTMRGAVRGLFTNRAWEWTRTPKYADLQIKRDWRQSNYQIQMDLLWIWEFVFVVMGLLALATAIQHIDFNALLILVPFTLSYGFVFFFSILQSRKTKA